MRTSPGLSMHKEIRMNIITGGVTAPQGFEAAVAKAGIKYEDRLDMALIYSKKSCRSAGLFTTNVVKAAPVTWSQRIVSSKGKIHAIIVNAGNANACTGEEGMAACIETAELVSNALEISPDDVLIASTGVIGQQLPMEKVRAAIPTLTFSLSDTTEQGTLAAQAIKTTDIREKQIAVRFEVDGYTITIGGMAKGSGMIHPDMATMLAFITTDAVISKKDMIKALKLSADASYHMISVDGDTSTNDSVMMLANGMAGNHKIKDGSEAFDQFVEALTMVNVFLAKEIARDGEGATALIEMKVEGASSLDQARALAKSVIGSNLTKAAVAGHDANWGRILCAMGYAGVSFDPAKVSLVFASETDELQIMEHGVAVDFDESKASEILASGSVTITANIHEGEVSASAWGCDLTHGYIDINADYRS